MSDDEDNRAEEDWKKALSGNLDFVTGGGSGGRDAGAIKHAEDAIDYADEDLSDDDLPDEEAPSGNNPIDDDGDAGFGSFDMAGGTKPLKPASSQLPASSANGLVLPSTKSSNSSAVNLLSGRGGQGSSSIPSGVTSSSLKAHNINTEHAIWGNNDVTGSSSIIPFPPSTSTFPGLSLPVSTSMEQEQDIFSAAILDREMSLEERVGSDYAAAVNAMTFDDDWLSGNVGANNSSSSTFGVFDSIPHFPLPTSSAGINSSMGFTPSLNADFHSPLPLPASVGAGSGISASLDGKDGYPVNGSAARKDKLTNNDQATEELLRQYFPDFQRGKILKMNAIFGPRGRTLVLPQVKPTRPIVPTRANLEIEPDQKILFQRNKSAIRENFNYGHVTDINPTTSATITDSAYRKLEDFEGMNQKKLNPQREEENILIAAADWNLDHLWESDDDHEDIKDAPTENVTKSTKSHDSDSSESESENDLPQHQNALITRTLQTLPQRGQKNKAVDDIDNRPSKKVKFVYSDMYDSEDEDGFLEGVINFKKPKVILDMNDSKLLFTDDTQALNLNLAVRRQQPIVKHTDLTSKSILQRYNISNDRAYDLLKENYQSKVRSIISELHIDHSMVAQRLQSPHYKAKLTKDEMRSFHRPSFNINPGTVIHFSKIKQRKRKRDKGKPITELLSKTTDLTLGDSAQFFMLEYSEEFPLVLSSFGMGNKLINYYRKTSPDDRTRPKLPTGETNVLGVEDKSAFWNFGFIEPGNVVPALYNKMIRAPIFKHDPKQTDFLLIRSTGGGQGTRHFLRTIPYLFTVGQTFPVTPIPGPHSRKVTTASKNRLKMIVFRLLNKNEHQRINVKDISPHFPDHNEMQNRQRLKDFMVFQRTGNDYSYWKIKPTETLLNENGIRAMISPEDIALLDAMHVGQQHLEDAGYAKTVEDDDDENEGMSIEEQLAPWNITRNFINATQGKAMLQLHGEGDPSGCGEAFSFLRTSMKGGFRAMGESVNERLDKSKFGGHSYNVALQQKAYDEEIKRIWYTQSKALSNTNTDHLEWDETESKRENDLFDSSKAASAAPNQTAKGDSESLFSHASASQGSKVLRITRFVRDENGTVQRQVEVVHDPNLIRAYVKRRQKMEDELMAQRTDEIVPTNDDEINKRNRKILEQEIAKLQRNQDRRMVRRALKAGLEPPKKIVPIPVGTGPGDKKNKSNKGVGKGKSTTRKCATCGAIGHIRTNKSCPMYNERYGNGAIDNQQNNQMPMPNMPQNPPMAGASGSALL